MLQKLITRNSLIFLLASLLSTAALPNPVIPIPGQPQPLITPASPVINAAGYILMDANSGKILAEKNSDARMAPASLTKLMTMYVISNALKNGNIHFDDKVRISEKAWRTGGSRMFVKVNDEVPVRNLLQGIVVASGNDASVAMAEYLAGTEEAFASLMNTEAQQIGMTHSHFVDSNGLPNPNHYSTAHDLALLTQAIIQNFPEDYQLYSEKWFSWNNIRQPNRNRLLWRFQYADGLKTGHTEEAGFCLVGSASKDGTRLISVVMGAPSDSVRTEDSIRLLTYGFRFFETHKLYSGSTPLAEARVWKGQEKHVGLGLARDLYVTMPAGQYKNVRATMDLEPSIKAPVIKGQVYGTLKVTLNGQVLASEPLVALSDNKKGGLWRSMSDSLNFSFNRLFSRSNEKANNG
ncbi:MAG TPA: D-alanyl-D-alanine carboxypeptidase family protein [Gammaproteobacteria bacterium]|nr:D-alanyl-D-alanine carboxypeptidase family protein [Gammaproteobacteria bacterium]